MGLAGRIADSHRAPLFQEARAAPKVFASHPPFVRGSRLAQHPAPLQHEQVVILPLSSQVAEACAEPRAPGLMNHMAAGTASRGGRHLSAFLLGGT